MLNDQEILDKVNKVPHKYVPFNQNIWTDFNYSKKVLVRYARWIERAKIIEQDRRMLKLFGIR